MRDSCPGSDVCAHAVTEFYFFYLISASVVLTIKPRENISPLYHVSYLSRQELKGWASERLLSLLECAY